MAETTVVKLDIVQSSSRDLIGSSRSIVVKDGRPFVKAMPRNELTPRLLHGSTIPGRVHDPYVQTTNESQELVPERSINNEGDCVVVFLRHRSVWITGSAVSGGTVRSAVSVRSTA